MPNISTRYTTSVGSVKTQPAYLLQIIFPEVDTHASAMYCLSTSNYALSYDNKVWNNNIAFSITGITNDISSNSNGQLTIHLNPSDREELIALSLLSYRGFTGRSIKVWAYDAKSVVDNILNIEDAILVFDGVGDNVSINHTNIVVTLSMLEMKVLFSPRTRICKANGFNFLQPKGFQIPWGNNIFILE